MDTVVSSQLVCIVPLEFNSNGTSLLPEA